MLTKFVTATLLCLGASSLTQAATKLADFVTPCSLKDPKLDDCLTTQGRALLPHIVSGVRDWDIMPMDPLQIPKLELQKGNGGPAGISLKITNSKHYGWKTMVIKRVKFDLKTYNMQFDAHFPFYTILGNYEVKGRILLLPVVGSGAANITFGNTDLQVTAKVKVEERAGKMYLATVDGKSILTPEHINYKFENLFNNKELSEQMNVFLNQNSIDVFSELKSSAEGIMTDVILAVKSRIFNKFQFKQLFTDV